MLAISMNVFLASLSLKLLEKLRGEYFLCIIFLYAGKVTVIQIQCGRNKKPTDVEIHANRSINREKRQTEIGNLFSNCACKLATGVHGFNSMTQASLNVTYK